MAQGNYDASCSLLNTYSNKVLIESSCIKSIRFIYLIHIRMEYMFHVTIQFIAQVEGIEY